MNKHFLVTISNDYDHLTGVEFICSFFKQLSEHQITLLHISRLDAADMNKTLMKMWDKPQEGVTGPLTVGDERVYRVETRNTGAGRLRLLTPTDCVKDRLAAFFYWNDTMALEQALLVATEQPIDIADLRRWAKAEGEADKLAAFEEALGRV